MISRSARFFFIAFFSWSVIALAQDKTRVRRNVYLEFEPVPGATLYEVEVVRKGSKKPMSFKMKNAVWSANIRPGTYEMRMRSYDDRGAPGEWSAPVDILVKLPAIIVKAPAPDSTIKAKRAERSEVNFQWEKIPGADAYEVQIKSTDGTFNYSKKVDDNSHSVKLDPGRTYLWNAAALDRKGERGDQSEEFYRFDLQGPPLEKPKVIKPISKYVREVEWKPAEYATSYSYELRRYDSKKKTWDMVEQSTDWADTKLKMDVTRPGGRYRLAVRAHGPLREPSPKSQIEFAMHGGFKDEADFENARVRDSMTKPTNFYAIASYLITQVAYKAKNYDDNSAPTFDALGGTGRLGIGYQEPRSNWGGFLIVDYSGFIINGQNFRFASAEAHLTRKLEFGQGGLLLFGTGLYSKELPIVVGTTGDGFRGVGKARANGVHAGFSYWFPLNPRLGVQVNARAYHSVFGSTSAGSNVIPSLSYSYGLLGSYRLSRSWMGYAGYAYRADEITYEAQSGPLSFANPGQNNMVGVYGHYLNLILEWSF